MTAGRLGSSVLGRTLWVGGKEFVDEDDEMEAVARL